MEGQEDDGKGDLSTRLRPHRVRVDFSEALETDLVVAEERGGEALQFHRAQARRLGSCDRGLDPTRLHGGNVCTRCTRTWR